MLWQFTVGVSAKGKADRIVVHAEDALLAALKVKSERPDATIMYVRGTTRRHTSPSPHSYRRSQPTDPCRVSVLLKGGASDLHRQRELYSLQVHGLCRGLPVDCFYEVEECSSSSRRNHRLRCLRARMSVYAIKPDTEPGPKSGSTSTANILQFGPTSRGKSLRPQMPMPS